MDNNKVALIPSGPTSASGSTSATTLPASSTTPTNSVSTDSSSTGSASSVSTEDSTSSGGPATVLNDNPQDCGAEIDDATVPLIAQISLNSIFQPEFPIYYSQEIAMANIFEGDSKFGTISSPNVSKSHVEEYLETLKLG